MHKNHNLHFVKHKTANNRDAKNHNLVFQKHKLLLLPFSLFTLTLLSAYFLSHIPTTSHATSIVDRVSVSIDSITCTMEGNIASGNEHTTTISNGTSKEGIGVTELRTVCNDANGYSIYAIGYSGTQSDPYNNAKLAGRTDMVGITTGNKIATGTYDSTLPISDSLWSMKLIVDEDSYLPANLTIENGFNEYHEVPSFYTKVASYSTKTGESPNGVSTIKTTYAASVSDVETPDTYIGQVKYTMVHPDSGLDTSITFNDSFQLSGKTPVEDTVLYKMQDMNAVICNRVTNGQTSELIDIRDNKIYTIAKINGDCWMTQNLRFLGNTGSASGKMTMTSDTSNGANTTIDLYGLNSSDNGSFGAYSGHCDTTNGYNYACVYDSGSETTGVWYNYVAATAGTITTNSNTNEAYYSVCPKGWKLPTGAANTPGSDFYGLFQSTAWQTWIDANDYLTAFNAVPGGRYNSGSFINVAFGVWWQATVDSATSRYSLYYNSSNAQFISNNSNRTNGYFVRCVADNTMQNFSHEDATNLFINEIVQLRDARDDNIYEVKKMPDGSVWMINNLRLAKGVTLTNELSNVNSDGYTTPTAELANASGTLASGQETCSDDLEQGCWYNYCAATAGTYCSSASGVAEYDICPAGWHLPKQADALSVKTYPTHFNIVMAGNYENGNHRNENLVGTWWSTFYLGNNYQAALSGHSGQLAYSYSGGYRTAGNSIRCIFNNS